jgi:hypothetical protein
MTAGGREETNDTMNTLIDTETATAQASGNIGEFHITDDTGANWLLRRLANIEAEKQRITAQAAEMVKQLDADAARLKGLYEGELLEYCRRKMAQGGNRRRSVAFLQGSVCFRTVAPSIKVADVAAALAHAQTTAPDLVRSVVTLDAAGYRDRAAKHLQATGELLPGCDTTPAHETHRLTFGAKE